MNFSSDSDKFIITCAPRTGSTMLRMILNSHPKIICYGEVITQSKLPRLGKNYQERIQKTSEELAEIRDRDAVELLYQYIWTRNDKNRKSIGLKLKYRQLEEQFPDILQAILKDRSVSIIHLTRKNLLKRYVSNRLSGSGKTPELIRHPLAKSEQVKIKVDVQDCLENLKLTQASESKFRDYFSQHKVFEVVYEDIVESPEEILFDLQNFLGVKPKKLEFKTSKINSDSLENIVENYLELKQEFQNTPYLTYLD